VEILGDVSLEIKDTNSNHWHFEDYSVGGDDIVLTAGFRPLSNAYTRQDIAQRRILASFNNWAPCEYCQNPVIDSLDAVEAEAKFDYVLTICPYTAKWRNENSIKPRHIYSFYPYAEKIIPASTEKFFDVIYHGGIHGKEHMNALKIMKEFNYRYCSLSYGINKLTQLALSDATDVDLPFQKKIALISQTKISITFNQIHVSLAHLRKILGYRRKMPHASDFFNGLKISGFFHNHPWIGVLPQFKTRVHEAAISKTINLVKRDRWNVIEDYYVPGKEFMYFDNDEDLQSKIFYILKNWNSSEIGDMVERAFQKSKRYTTENFVRKYDKILRTNDPTGCNLFFEEEFWCD